MPWYLEHRGPRHIAEEKMLVVIWVVAGVVIAVLPGQAAKVWAMRGQGGMFSLLGFVLAGLWFHFLWGDKWSEWFGR